MYRYKPAHTITTFAEVKRTRTFKGKCPICGKTYQRTLSFSQTINPFNKNENGEVKTRREIEREISLKAAAAVMPAHCKE